MKTNTLLHGGNVPKGWLANYIQFGQSFQVSLYRPDRHDNFGTWINYEYCDYAANGEVVRGYGRCSEKELEDAFLSDIASGITLGLRKE